MRSADALEAIVLEASREIQAGIVAAGAGYRKLLPTIHEFAREAYRTGGGGSVDDLMAHASPSRIQTDICSLMVAVGLGDVLVAGEGKKSWRPEPDFAGRLEEVVNAGHFTATRGPEQPSPDPFSGYLYPGAKVHKR